MRRLPRRISALALLTSVVGILAAQQPAALTISTNSPLPSGVIDAAYSVALQANGGTPPLTWEVLEGGLPQGLGLSATTGTISGTPTLLGAFNFRIQVRDSVNQTAQKNFSITIDPRALTIVTAALPRGRVGVSYLGTLSALGGTPPYRDWRLTEGLLPGGIALNAASGELTGIPQAFGTFTFEITVSDNAFETTSKQFTVTIDPAALTLTTESPLPLGVIGTAYRQTLTAAGGPPPLAWSVTGNLPAGLALNTSTGEISGTPTGIGVFDFTVGVADSGGGTAAGQFELIVADPRAVVTLEGEQGPAQQRRVRLALSSAHGFPIAGQLSLSFAPDAINNSDDDTIRFSNNTRTAQFTVKKDIAEAEFTGGELQLQTGTTAGVITLRVTALQAGSQAIPPAADAKLDITIAQAAPTVSGASIANRSGTGFSLAVTGFSTAREVTRAVFRFTPVAGRTVQNGQVTVDLTAAANGWFQNTAAAATGGAFVYTQPFTIQGEISAIQSAAVTLTNSRGDSQSATVTF